MADYSSYYQARKIVTDILRKDLVGPVEDNECLTELPTQYYIMGKLYPESKMSEEDMVDTSQEASIEDSADSDETTISLSNQKTPSSMGITFSIGGSVAKVVVSGSYAFYDNLPIEKAGEYGLDAEALQNSQRRSASLWARKSFSFSKTIDFSKSRVSVFELDRGIRLHVFIHTVLSNGEKVVTASLLNTNVVKQDDFDYEEIARNCAFQPVIKVNSVDNALIFTDINKHKNLAFDKELQEMDMLYSDVHSYAHGHGCSVIWDTESVSPMWISTEWMPLYNLKQMMASQAADKTVLSMKFLATSDYKEITNKLNDFIDNYKKWINEISSTVKQLPAEMQEGAKKNIDKCLEAYSRIKSAIALLAKSGQANDRKAFYAFQLANKAMLMQRERTVVKSGKQFDPNAATWYPFQLAFILQELESFINPNCDDRKKVDLLWFPTGGGKTEAYLGISAFTIFLRRLKNVKNDGVNIIMRYTLRLLTLQQFERASMLICACELLRRKEGIGGSKFTIGLWVGGKLTPNKLAEARTSINNQKNGEGVNPGETNPCQIQVCPWCGEKLYPFNYSVDGHKHEMNITCSNDKCEFSKLGLPIHIIDEAIYHHQPTFLVATVDKFAQLPLSDKPAALFGINNEKNPPDLIIQDELHLISGPLGTMTGIYEAAISILCERNGIPAKVIASTATIRNAANQIKSLFGRDFAQFPPQGISAKDSFFAVESTEADRPAREYCGVLGVGTTTTTTLIRVYAALLFATRRLQNMNFDDSVIDNFWTITGYFNTIRQLGAASTQILDDVQSRLSYLAKTKFAKLLPLLDPGKGFSYVEELTSRMDNTQITEIIQDRLKRSYKNGEHTDVYDFILASNMISVGVDVGRLGCMVVMGQPKTNAEYIQATSRVGRDNPGLVITIFNSSRSRDRSHYEQFLKYHSAMYRYVEATSLTPFADRARDRGLHALYVTLCRYLIPDMLSNESAAKYKENHPEAIKIRNRIAEYVGIVDPDEKEAVIKELSDISYQWQQLAGGDLVYKNWRSGGNSLLKNDVDVDRFRTMNSMRNVDAQSGIFLTWES